MNENINIYRVKSIFSNSLTEENFHRPIQHQQIPVLNFISTLYKESTYSTPNPKSTLYENIKS